MSKYHRPKRRDPGTVKVYGATFALKVQRGDKPSAEMRPEAWERGAPKRWTDGPPERHDR